jgi:glyoxylase-like metal-dependent hydrolase (beta-lactamase superfamily II)
MDAIRIRQISSLDLRFRGISGAIASYLIPHKKGAVLVECGPGSTLPILQAQLIEHGYTPQEITDVLVTHIHLDHAGAAGWFAEQGACIHVHPLGAPHLINPEKLLASAERIYGDQMGMLWGEFQPVPASNLEIHHDQDQIQINELTFQVLETPGHASHHNAYLLDGVCFCGDIGGVRMSGARHVRLPMPPPEFDPRKWRSSLGILRRQAITHMLPTHFGVFSDVAWHLDAIDRALDDVEDWMDQFMPLNLPDHELKEAFIEWETNRAKIDHINTDYHAVYRTANPVEISLLGIKRFWKIHRQ